MSGLEKEIIIWENAGIRVTESNRYNGTKEKYLYRKTEDKFGNPWWQSHGCIDVTSTSGALVLDLLKEIFRFQGKTPEVKP